MTVDRSQWWVALDDREGACVWMPHPVFNGMAKRLLEQSRTKDVIWEYVTEGLPDRGDCTDCTAVPCPAHDLAGVTIPKDQP